MTGSGRRQFTAAEVAKNVSRTHGDRRPAAASKPRRRGDHGGRWLTLNQFVDVIAPHLSLAERAVWLVMFRLARGGVCETTERRLAVACRINKKTAGRALRELVQLRLVWPIHLSVSREAASKYGMHPAPADRLSLAVARGEAIVARKKPGALCHRSEV